jgi:hypothetical protein
VERRRGTVGSGDGGAAARRGGEWSGVRARRSGERQRGTVGSGVPARCGGEWRHDAVGSGDGGVRRESMGIGERSAVRALVG